MRRLALVFLSLLAVGALEAIAQTACTQSSANAAGTSTTEKLRYCSGSFWFESPVINGFTASRCARFDSNGKLAPATGDCAGGAGAATRVDFDADGTINLDYDGTYTWLDVNDDGVKDLRVDLNGTIEQLGSPADGTRGLTTQDNSSTCPDPASGSTSMCFKGGSMYVRDTGGPDRLTAEWPVVRSMAWDAGGMSTDGTNCATPTEQTLNSGPKTWAFSCADSNSSIFYGKTVMPDGWNAGTLIFELELFHGTTETITFAGDFSCECHAAGEVIDGTWGTAQAADVAITTANQHVNATTAATTCAGTCAAGDLLFWRYVVDAANFSTNAANAKVLGVKMEYTATSGD